MEYLPVNVQLSGRKCLLVGGGEVAARKLRMLLSAHACVTLVSPDICEEIAVLEQQNQVTLIRETFSQALLQNCYLVIVATDELMLSRRVSVAAQQLNIWVNVADNQELSTFILPAIINRSPLMVSVSSSGVSPVLARKVREQIEWLLPASLPGLLNKLKSFRPLIKSRLSSFKEKRSFSEWFIEKALSEAVEPQATPEHLINEFRQTSPVQGKVYLIGAGPGSADLLTVRALRLLQKADVVLYDALVTQEVLDCVRKDAKLVHVGKRCGNHFVPQDKTSQMLRDYAQKGLSVVRLKGGDPFVFGRGGEELQYLSCHQIAFEVVPGITAASGCAAYAGIPLTHRLLSQSVRFITGHGRNEGSDTAKNDKPAIDWESMLADNQTLVFYMGLVKTNEIASSLIRVGKKADTPVAVIENGTTEQQRVVTGQLSELPAIVIENNIQSPALIIVGEVTRLANQLSWFKQSEYFDTDVSTPSEMAGING